MTSDTNLLLHALDERLEKFRMQYKLCRRDFSEPAVHDLRVASRRLLAGLELARVVLPKPSLQKARHVLKDFLDELDELRDIQVQLVDFAKLLNEFPQLESIVKRLKKRETKLLETASKVLKKSKLTGINQRVEKARARLARDIPESGFDASLLRAVDEAFARARQAYGRLDAMDADSVHRLRIAFKKFRYSVEVAAPLLGETPADYFKSMHAYQSRMGNVQDARVMLEMLAGFAKRNSQAELSPVRQALENRRDKLIGKFMKSKEELMNFWRATPEAAFPWEAR